MSRRPKRSALVAACALIALSGHARADDAQDATASASLVKAFASLCVQSMSDLDRVENSAAGLGWRKLKGAEAKSFATPSPDATTTTWLVPHVADMPFWLSITHGMDSGKSVSACTLINSDAPPEPTKTAMVDQLELKHPFRNETEGDQDFTYWQIRVAGTPIIISLMNASSVATKGVNMSATLIPKRAFQ